MKLNGRASAPDWGLLGPVLIAGAIVLAYANSFSCVFLFDDFVGIVRNPRIRTLSSAVAASSRPLVDATFWLNFALDGLRVAGYHLVNLAIHVGAALALFGIGRRTLKLGETPAAVRPAADGLALCIALLWGVHPLLTGSVTYICQRAESLMGCLYLLTLYGAIRAHLSGGWPWRAATVACCALGMGTKEVMITAPVMVVLYDRAFLFSSLREAWTKRRALYVGLAATWLMLAAWMQIRKSSDPFNFYAWHGIGPLSYARTQFGVVAHYLRLALWPDSLCLDYRWPVAESWREVWPSAAGIAALGAVLLWAWWRRPRRAFPGVWTCVILAPTSTFIARPDCAFEHRMYLPLAGIVAYAVLGGHRLLEGRSRVACRGTLAAALAVALGWVTHVRNQDYRSEAAMWQDVVNKRPQNLRAGNDLAVALSEAGRFGEAIREYNRVLDLIPPGVRAKLESGAVTVGPTFDTESCEYHYFRAHANLGLLYYREKGDRAAARRHYEAALKVAPGQPDVAAKLKALEE